MYAEVGYDPIRDFVTIVRVAHNPLLMVVHPSMPVKSFKDLVALAKSRPGQINFATGGIGSSPHMSMELVKSMTKIDMVPVHYKGDGAAIIDVLGGTCSFSRRASARCCRTRAAARCAGISVTSLKRSAMAPEFPTLRRVGPQGLRSADVVRHSRPAGMPQQIVNRLNTEILQVVAQPAARDQLLKMGFEIAAPTRRRNTRRS